MLVEVQNYFNDGANYQAKAVLAVFQCYCRRVLDKVWNKDLHKSDALIYVGRYENLREQGYVFSLMYKGKQKHYAVYEHRNSDNICVLISNQMTLNTPSVNIMWADKGVNASKYDVDKMFGCEEFVECAEYIVEEMTETLTQWEKNSGE